MLGSTILEVAIGVIFIFLLVSTICTAIREGIESKLKSRAAYLEQGIRQLLNDPKGSGLAKSLYNHPLIYGLFNSAYKPGTNTKSPDLLAKGGELPSYIPSKNFASALMDIAARGTVTDEYNSTAGSSAVTLDTIRQNIAGIENPFVQRVLLNAIDTAQGDLNKAQANIEAWFNSSMDRVSGWYKRSTQWIIFWVAIAVSVGLNINTITIVNYLASNDTARKIAVEHAATTVKDSTAIDYEKAKEELASLKLPIGWSDGWKSAAVSPNPKTAGFWNYFLGPLLGWLITAFAATLGAPFWFDMLNKMMVIRSTVKPHEKSQEEASEDRQLSPLPAPAPAGVPAGQPGTPPPDAPAVIPALPEADGCEVVAVNLTGDEDLPVSKGGVA